MIYSAGINRLASLPHLDLAEMHDIMSVNVYGFVQLMGWVSVAKYPISVVAIVSDAHRIPMRMSMSYCVSKAALAMAVRVAARELAPLHRVNGVAPAMVDGTAMTEYIDRIVPEIRGWTPEQARAYEESNIPMGRRASTNEVAQLTLSVLQGPEFMTGSIVEMTGGR